MQIGTKSCDIMKSLPVQRERVRKREKSSSPKSKGDERPNADVVPGRHPERWRKDAAGNVVCGESTEGNCHIPQTRVNRYKSDKRQSRHNSVGREGSLRESVRRNALMFH
ncbi:hypothetical protein C1H46_035256 [Malus baccata]|uniref:Uncharacterized protein n=1 Tax=Malus baccata TaxID=106549 RepID=A0A540KYB5_MALBA|nr:hypothetical protein C1H46_035256 [Malus baccata]